jgi:hypothetical protein
MPHTCKDDGLAVGVFGCSQSPIGVLDVDPVGDCMAGAETPDLLEIEVVQAFEKLSLFACGEVWH